MGGVTVCAETDFATREAVHVLECGIIARFPRPPNAQGGLARVDVATPPAAVTVAAMDARSTDEAIQACLDGFHGVTGFD